MPNAGVHSLVHSERLQAAARLVRRGGPEAATCGARTRSGAVCTQEPLVGGHRCLRHGGPKAAAAHRERQLAGMRSGRVTPEVFARAEARRARNRLLDAWKRNPSLPGATIALGEDEGRFQDALAVFGVQSGTDLPAVMDWLRWRFRRHMIDHADVGAWTRAVRDGLPGRRSAAGEAMQWVRLGDHDRRTLAGRAIMAALKAGGEDHAAALAERLAVDAAPARPGPRPGLSPRAPRPWRAGASSPSMKRRRANQPKAAKPAMQVRRGPPPRQARAAMDADELDALVVLLHRSGPDIRRLFAVCEGADDQIEFLRALRDFQQDPDDALARDRWLGCARSITAGRA